MSEIITDGQARRIASEWHGGQWSTLYSFTSTGAIDFQPLKDEILFELRDTEDQDELKALMRYVRDKGPRERQEGWYTLWDDTQG